MSTLLGWLLSIVASAWTPMLTQGPLTDNMRYFLTDADNSYDVYQMSWKLGCMHVIANYQEQFEYLPAPTPSEWDTEFSREPLLCMDF